MAEKVKKVLKGTKVAKDLCKYIREGVSFIEIKYLNDSNFQTTVSLPGMLEGMIIEMPYA